MLQTRGLSSTSRARSERRRRILFVNPQIGDSSTSYFIFKNQEGGLSVMRMTKNLKPSNRLPKPTPKIIAPQEETVNAADALMAVA